MKTRTKTLSITIILALFALFTLQNPILASPQPTSFKVDVIGKGQDIILIPGLMSDGRIWSDLAKDLSKNYKLHIINIAGFASTLKIEGQSLERVKQELFEYINQNKINDPIIIGHSLGGFMAFWMASSEPDIIGKIISIDGLPFIGPVFTGTNNATVESLNSQANQMKNFYSHMSAEQLEIQNTRGVGRQATSKENKNKVITMASQSDPSTVGEMIFTLMSTDLRQNISQIKNPALLIGAAGGFTSKQAKQTAKRLYQQQLSELKGATLIMNNDSRHFIMFDQPEWLAKQVKFFLAANH